ncbi:MAG: hypothetical protein K2H09_06735 [Treponemataceae bacterium]|nr:hypothetical protein [Treponemataceae bacterium]
MKPEKLFTVLFVCMGVLLAVLYGAFELGGWEMGMCEKVFKIIAIGLVVVAVIIVAVFACIAIATSKQSEITIKNGKIVFNGESCCSLYIANEDDCSIPKATEAVIVTGNFCLCGHHFEDIKNVKKIYFCNKHHRMEAEMFNSLKKKVVIVDTDNGNVVLEFH